MRGWLWLLMSVFLTASTWLYVHRILWPWQHHVNVEVGTMKAELGDLYTPWAGTRELLLNRRNPYSQEVTDEIQMAFYGRIIRQAANATPESAVDEQRFAYPVYVVFLMAPAVNSTFAEAQTWAPVILAVFTVIGLLLWFDTLRWLPSWPTIAAVLVFIFGTPPIIQALRLRQLGLLVGFLLALAAWCVSRNRLGIAGVVLAISTIKPQMVLLALLWFLCWSVGDWHRRWRLPAALVGTLAVLIGAGEIILPGWPRYFFAALQAYRHYTYRPPLLELALGHMLGEILAGVAILGLLALAWQNRKEPGNSPGFTRTLAIFLAASPLTMPLLPLFNHLLLILPIIVVLRDWRSLRAPDRYILIAVLGWPAIASIALLLWFPVGSYPSNRILLLPSLLSLFLPFLLIILLMGRQTIANRTSTYDGNIKAMPLQ